jgi:hypothetical protein
MAMSVEVECTVPAQKFPRVVWAEEQASAIGIRHRPWWDQTWLPAPLHTVIEDGLMPVTWQVCTSPKLRTALNQKEKNDPTRARLASPMPISFNTWTHSRVNMKSTNARRPPGLSTRTISRNTQHLLRLRSTLYFVNDEVGKDRIK